jgi:hypothetical protein
MSVSPHVVSNGGTSQPVEWAAWQRSMRRATLLLGGKKAALQTLGECNACIVYDMPV